MPVNINAVGTSGIGGKSGNGGYSEILNKSESIHSKVNSLDMTELDISTSQLYHGYASYSSGTSYENTKFTYPIIRYNGELYTYYCYSAVHNGSSSASYDELYKMTYNSSGSVTYTKIAIPFHRIYEFFVYNGLLYLCVGTSSYYYMDMIYSFDGSTFTAVSPKFSSSLGMNGGGSFSENVVKVNRVIDEYNNACWLFICVMSNSSSSIYVYCNICKIDRSGVFEIVLPANKISYGSYFGISNTYSSPIYDLTYKLACQVSASPSSSAPMILSCAKVDNGYEFIISSLFITNSNSTSGSMSLIHYVTKLSILLKSGESYYKPTFTQLTNYTVDSINGVYIQPNTGWTNDDYYKYQYMVLSAEKPDTYILLLHRGYYVNDNCNSIDRSLIPNMYLVKTSSNNVTFKKLNYEIPEATLTNGTGISTRSMFDIENEIPTLHLMIFTQSGSYDYWNYYIYEINMSDAVYNSTGSTYTITTELLKGDTCLSNAVIKYYEHNGSIVQVNKSSATVNESGVYTFVANTYDAYRRPDFIIKSKSGNLMNMDITYTKDNKYIEGYFQNGMSINGFKITTNGYNKITTNTLRVDVVL